MRSERPGDAAADTLHHVKDAIHARLTNRREIDFHTGCWIWTGAWQESSGLGIISVFGKKLTVSRVAYWIYEGGFDLWDMSVRVAHRPGYTSCCPACFNPAHLVLRQKGVGIAIAPWTISTAKTGRPTAINRLSGTQVWGDKAEKKIPSIQLARRLQIASTCDRRALAAVA